MNPRWYVAQCRPNAESWAIKNLQRQSFEVYWPHYQIKSKNGPNRMYFRGIFPGYLFVGFDIDFSDDWHKISSTYGIRRLIGATDYGILPLPVNFVESMIKSSPDGLVELPKEKGAVYSPGDRLKITSGPLSGQFGVMKYSEKGRISLLMQLLGGERQVIIPVHNVQYAGPAN